ncbi:MAG: hypothetical protein KDK39_13550 [Leptospiraceae bacterium]|nr:hypothetical protein [Leptospiraceae bacterium]
MKIKTSAIPGVRALVTQLRLTGRRLILASLSVIAISLGHCSELYKSYYIVAEDSQTDDQNGCYEYCSRRRVAGMDMLFYSHRRSSRARYGPCLLPLIADDYKPIDVTDLNLFWVIDKPAAADLALLHSSLIIELDSGQLMTPAVLYVSNLAKDKIQTYRLDDSYRYSGEMGQQESYPLTEPQIIEIIYKDFSNVDTDWFKLEPAFRMNGGITNGGPLRFRVETDYEYHPWRLPFLFMPVR